MIDPEKLESFARASRRSGVMSGVGALVVFAALGYGIWETMRLNQRIEERKSELQELKAKAEDARTEIAILDGQKKLLLDQIKAIETAVQNVEPDGHVSRILGSVSKREPTPVPAQDRAKSATTLTPIFAVVKPRAEAHPSGSRNTSGQLESDYSLWIDVPAVRASEIRSVSYEFNHPTFAEKLQTSSDRSTGFRVGYRGWGCLSLVIVTLTLFNGETQPLNFDMCEAVQSTATK